MTNVPLEGQAGAQHQPHPNSGAGAALGHSHTNLDVRSFNAGVEAAAKLLESRHSIHSAAIVRALKK